MKPKIQKKIKFDNTCNCIVDYDLLEKAMLWYSDHNLFSERKIFLHGRYPAISIYDEKIHVHRLLLMYKYKYKLHRSLISHHKNMNKLDCTECNLELLTSRIHAYHHHKGKKLSKNHRLKIAEANKKRKGIKIKRKYNIPIEELKNKLKQGLSINAIAKSYGCNWCVVKNRINENQELLE